MALDSVISIWTPTGSVLVKRLTPTTAGGTVALDLGRGSVLPVRSIGTSNSVLQLGTLDALIAGGLDTPSLLVAKGQRSSSQEVKTPVQLTGS